MKAHSIQHLKVSHVLIGSRLLCKRGAAVEEVVVVELFTPSFRPANSLVSNVWRFRWVTQCTLKRPRTPQNKTVW